MESKNKLPSNPKLNMIKGGTHSQFSYLGTLLSDESPDISLQDQQKETFDHLI